MSEIVRETGETRVAVRVSAVDNADPAIQVHTTDAFLDHMVRTLGRYAGLNLSVAAQGDLRHHLIEDVAITLGLALREELPATCRRFGHAVVPMDEALVEAALDAGGRAFYLGRLPSTLYEHFFRSLAENAGFTLHLRVLRGRDRHHVVEAAFKAFGFALRAASAAGEAVFSTKGAVRVERSREP
jgi:imidazoleglycerol-phosphate dehydratase